MRIHRGNCPPCQEWHWQPTPEGMSPLRGILSTSAYMSERQWQRERDGLRNEVDAAHAVTDDLEETNTHQAAEIARLRDRIDVALREHADWHAWHTDDEHFGHDPGTFTICAMAHCLVGEEPSPPPGPGSALMADFTKQQTEIARLRRELTARSLAHVAQPPAGA